MIHIIGGGTFAHVRNHLALSAPAFGTTARQLYEMFKPRWAARNGGSSYGVNLHLTKMADHTSDIVTNDDVSALLDTLIANPETRVIIMNAALCDYNGVVEDYRNELYGACLPSGKYAERLKTRDGQRKMMLLPSDKLVGKIRKERKDIFVVGFKTTTGATSHEQYLAALNLLKANSLNLVLSNDTVTRHNMIVAPEETRYFETDDRDEVLTGLVEIVLARMNNTFTRSTVIGTEDADTVAWDDPRVPANLREVVNHCIARGSYKKFRGVTAGHFAVRLSPTSILTSKRKRDFNRLSEVGLVRVDYDGFDKVIAHGAKPSVGGQSQRIIFDEHPDLDCIVHAHISLKSNPRDQINIDREQALRECGSHQCGAATSAGLRPHPHGIQAVMLDNHGPNIVFSRETPAEKVIEFIESNFDFDRKTGGSVDTIPDAVSF